MNINFSNPQNSVSMTGKMIPVAEYKGIVLKLTQADKTKIAKLVDEKAAVEMELYKLIQWRKQQKIVSDSLAFYYDYAYEKLESRINSLMSDIKEIKISRLNKQKAKAAKLDLIG